MFHKNIFSCLKWSNFFYMKINFTSNFFFYAGNIFFFTINLIIFLLEKMCQSTVYPVSTEYVLKKSDYFFFTRTIIVETL